MDEDNIERQYTCQDYREEMVLAGLHKRLQQDDLADSERLLVLQEIARLEEKMGL